MRPVEDKQLAIWLIIFVLVILSLRMLLEAWVFGRFILSQNLRPTSIPLVKVTKQQKSREVFAISKIAPSTRTVTRAGTRTGAGKDK